MRIRYDKEADIFYLKFNDDKIIESDEIRKGVIADFGKNGRIIGIEILNAKKILKDNPEIIMDFSSNPIEA